MAAGGASWSLGGLDEQVASACLEAALDAGLQVVDTAGAYTTTEAAHHNEQLVARVLSQRCGSGALRSAPDPAGGGRPVVVTKCGHHRTSATTWDVDGRPEVLRRDVEGSLRTLRTDALDVCLLHHPDPAVPLEESVGALVGMQREGLVRSVGVSNTSAAQLRALLDGPLGASVSVLQAPVPAVRPSLPLDVRAQLELCRAAGVQVMGYAPFEGPGRLGAALAARRAGGATGSAGAPPLLLDELSRQWDASVHRLLLAHLLLEHPDLTAVVGSTRPAQARDAAAAAALATDLAADPADPTDPAGSRRLQLSAAVADLRTATATSPGLAPTDPHEEP